MNENQKNDRVLLTQQRAVLMDSDECIVVQGQQGKKLEAKKSERRKPRICY
jgi:hypothetical protein